MTLLAHQAILTPSGAASLYAAIMATPGLAMYHRNGETSTAGGMINEVGANGTYVGNPGVGAAAIYPGAGAGFAPNNFANIRYGNTTVNPGTLNELTVFTVAKFGAVAGFQSVGTSRDALGTRKWQFRTNGTALEFVKIVGGVTTATSVAALTTGVGYTLAVTVSAAGSIKLYKNGVLLSTTASTAANYGGVADAISVGFSAGASAALTPAGACCENAIFSTELSAATLLAFHTASGL